MGLDSVELVMGFEEAFSLQIPDDVAAELITPRKTIDYIASILEPGEASSICLSQQTFYRLRRGLASALSDPRRFRPSDPLRAIVEKRDWPALWSRVRREADAPYWPAYVSWGGWFFAGPTTLGELTAHLAMYTPPDTRRGESWTRERIEWMVRGVIRHQLGIEDFGLDDHYVRDMGVD